LVSWKFQLNEYDYEVEYNKGSENIVEDALSRVYLEVNTHCVDVGKYEIKNSETPLNEFNIQIIILINPNSTTKDETLFENKSRKTYAEPNFATEKLSRILNDTLRPQKACAVLTSDEIFELIRPIFKEHFTKTDNYNVVRCKEILRDVITEEEQEA